VGRILLLTHSHPLQSQENITFCISTTIRLPVEPQTSVGASIDRNVWLVSQTSWVRVSKLSIREIRWLHRLACSSVMMLVKTNMDLLNNLCKYLHVRSIRFTCTAEGLPQPSVVWYKDSVALSLNNLPPKYSLTSNLANLSISNVCKLCLGMFFI